MVGAIKTEWPVARQAVYADLREKEGRVTSKMWRKQDVQYRDELMSRCRVQISINGLI